MAGMPNLPPSHPLAEGLYGEQEFKEYRQLLNKVSTMITNQVKAEMAMVTPPAARIGPDIKEQLKADIKAELEFDLKREFDSFKRELDSIRREIDHVPKGGGDTSRSSPPALTVSLPSTGGPLADQRATDMLQSMESHQRITSGLLSDVASLSAQISSMQEMMDAFVSRQRLQFVALGQLALTASELDKNEKMTAMISLEQEETSVQGLLFKMSADRNPMIEPDASSLLAMTNSVLQPQGSSSAIQSSSLATKPASSGSATGAPARGGWWNWKGRDGPSISETNL